MNSDTMPHPAPPPAAPTQMLEELLRKYDVSAPRYTSYPPVPFWGDMGPGQVESWLGEADEPAQSPISLYFHIPFCATRCYYCGCFVIITLRKSQAAPYLEALEKEVALVHGRIDRTRPVRQFHLGGGTPTFISPREMTHLVETTAARFPLEPGLEMSIEVDPRTVDKEYFDVLRGLGFNRISLGVQDFDDTVMKSVNRVQPFDQVAKAVDRARAAGFVNINFDLIYGLPHQSRESFAKTLEGVRSLRPGRLALYNYAHLPTINPYQRRFGAEVLPGKEEKTAIFLLAREKLTGWGYQAIGMDHFALPEDDLAEAFRQGKLRRNFMGYTTQTGTDLLAFGASAISEFRQGFWQNEKKLNRYLSRVENGELPIVRGLALGAEDRLRKEVISDLFCKGGVVFEEIEQRFGISFGDHFGEALQRLQPLAADGLLVLEPGAVRITERGQLFLRNAAMVFDGYLGQPDAEPGRFSRVL